MLFGFKIFAVKKIKIKSTIKLTLKWNFYKNKSIIKINELTFVIKNFFKQLPIAN